jgi:hypothetical protein
MNIKSLPCRDMRHHNDQGGTPLAFSCPLAQEVQDLRAELATAKLHASRIQDNAVLPNRVIELAGRITKGAEHAHNPA